MELVVLIGIPGSGKSSFYKKIFFNTHLRISLDMLKTRKREDILLHFCFAHSYRIVVDNSNVSQSERSKYIKLGRKFNFKITGYFFESDIEKCIQRNSQREGMEQVPLVGMYSKFKQFERPFYEEGFEELYFVKLSGDTNFIVEAVKKD